MDRRAIGDAGGPGGVADECGHAACWTLGRCERTDVGAPVVQVVSVSMSLTVVLSRSVSAVVKLPPE